MAQSGSHAWNDVWFPTINGPVACTEIDFHISWASADEKVLVTYHVNGRPERSVILSEDTHDNFSLSSASGMWSVAGTVKLSTEHSWERNNYTLSYDMEFIYSPEELSLKEIGVLGMWAKQLQATNK